MNKKAFTLIELLATIVILAIISLIVIPIVLNMIENSKIKATEQSLNGVVRSLKQQYARNNLTKEVKLPIYILYGDSKIEEEIEGIVFNEEQDYTKEVETQGIKPTRGVIVLNENGKATTGLNGIRINNYTCEIKDDKAKCNIKTYTKESCFTINSSGVITKYTCDYKSIVIPPTINNISVKSIGTSAFRYNALTKLDLSNNINLTTIGEGAFYSNDITKLDLSKNTNLTTIGGHAFSNNGITELKLPTSLTSIGDGAFTHNKLPENQAYIYGRNNDRTIDYTNLVSYGGLNTEIKIPSTVTRIGWYAFSNGTNEITSVDFSEAINLHTIGFHAFHSNDLTKLDLSNNTNLTTIGEYAFYGNDITELKLPPSLTTIGDSAFRYNALTKLDLSNNINLTTIGEGAFYSNDITKLDLSKNTNLTAIGDSAFCDNDINELKLQTSLTTIGFYAFSLNSITKLDLSANTNLTTIGGHAFYNNGITELKLPTSLTSIGDGAFTHNKLPENQAYIYGRNNDRTIDYTNLVSYGGLNTEIKIPSTVTRIGWCAFSNGTNEITSVDFSEAINLHTIGFHAFHSNALTELDLSNNINLTTIGEYAFYNNALIELKLPPSLTTIGTSAFKKTTSSNPNLTKIKSNGKTFDWQSITGSSTVTIE